MSDTTSKVEQILTAQASKEVTANAVFNALSPYAALGRFSTTTGLTWAYTGFDRWYVNATAVNLSSANMTLTASGTRYVAVSRTPAVSDNASAFPPDKYAAYKVTTSASACTAWEDHRDPHHLVRFLYGRFTLAMADANKTLTYEQAMCESMELTGVLTALRDVVVPLVPRSWIVFANVTGGFGVRVIGASGAGITVADGKRAIVECDGTNVVRVTADV